MPKRSSKRRGGVSGDPGMAPAPKAARARAQRALIRIDNQPIRDRARKAYEQAREKLAKAEAELEKHRTKDVPAFDRWLHANFGALLTELREADRQRIEQEILLDEIAGYSWSEKVSRGAAYAAVMHRRENPSAAPEPAPGSPPPPPPGFADSNRDDDDDDFSNGGPGFGSAADQDAFRDFARSFEEFFGQSIPPGAFPFGIVPPGRKTATVKDLYRNLVRKLHPDTQETMTAQKLEWWHEVQEAYAANDADRLEVILSQVELAADEPGTHTSVSMFNRLTARLRSGLREIRRQLTESRGEPAWSFTRSNDHSVLAARLRKELGLELSQLRAAVRENADELARLAAEARRLATQGPRAARKKPRRRPSGGQDEFRF